MSRIHSYVVQHDVGFAPNPFWGFCTLANCKPDIRKDAKIGDRIIGTGSKTANQQGYLVYWMIVDKIITFDEYWKNKDYILKKPNLRGSKIQHRGDNIYHANTSRKFIQEDSFHSKPNGERNEKNVKTDTGRTQNVLIGNEFCYLGQSAIEIPDHLKHFVKMGPGRKNKFSAIHVAEMNEWLGKNTAKGIQGNPVRW